MSDKALDRIGTGWTALGAWERLTFAFADAFERWRERMRTRRDLAMLSGRELRELGVSEATARDEISRGPWFDYSPAWRTAEQERRAVFAARRRF